MTYRRIWPAAVLAVAVGASALLVTSCGDGGSPAVPSSPAAPTPPPSTTPPSSGGSGSSTCALGDGDPNAVCNQTFTELIDYVLAAQDQLVQEQPQLFDLNIEAGDETRQYLVLDKEGYIDGLVEALNGMGLCAGRSIDDYEIVQVKADNSYSEDFDIYSSDGFVRRGNGTYRQTCSPAAFPLVRPENAPPQGSGCGRPYPPPVTRLRVYLHLTGQEYDTLDATPLVGPDWLYCASIGFTDGRSLCPVRPEGHPEREACETWAVGHAQDTGRAGPTWTNTNGEFCTGTETGCINADNQYSLWAYTSGTYTACAENQACGSIDHVR